MLFKKITKELKEWNMGCWLGTDGITGATIREGEDCYALIVAGGYMSIMFPFLGKYDELGKIEDLDARPGDFVPDETLKYLNRLKDDKSIYINKDSRDGDIKMEESISDWLENSERQNLSWRRTAHKEKDSPINLVLFSKDVFEKAIEIGKKAKLWTGSTRESILSPYADKILERVKKCTGSFEHDFMIDYEVRESVDQICGKRHAWKNNFVELLTDVNTSVRAKKELLGEMLRFSYFLYFMDDMRLNVGRAVNSGGQDSNLGVQSEFYKFAYERASKKEWEYQCEIYREDYEEGILYVGEKVEESGRWVIK